jgi:hypothetical protein
VPPSLVVEGTGHLPVYPVEVLFRLLLKDGESLDFFTDLSLQRFHSAIKRGHTSKNDHRVPIDSDSPSQRGENSFLAMSAKEHLSTHEARLKGRMSWEHAEPPVGDRNDDRIDRGIKNSCLWG